LKGVSPVGGLAEPAAQREQQRLAELDQRMKESENKEWFRDGDEISKSAAEILTDRAKADKERGTDFI